jgi:hypothetical protein
MILLEFPLEALQTLGPDQLPRVRVAFPQGSQILHLGSTGPDKPICLCVLAPLRPKNADGTVKELAPHEVAVLEFIVAVPGNLVPEGYVFRAPVRTPEGGLIYLFEKRDTSPLLVPGRIARA